MTKQAKQATRPLSIRAQRLLERVHSGRWYAFDGQRTPAAMKELLAAGLVVTGGRVKVMEMCYVPKGTRPFVMERYPNAAKRPG